MARIFRASYEDILSRVDGRTERRRELTEAGSVTFSKVLGDLEKGAQRASFSGESEAFRNIPNHTERLSNLLPGEALEAQSQGASLSIEQGIDAKPNKEVIVTAYRRVSNPELSVKNIALTTPPPLPDPIALTPPSGSVGLTTPLGFPEPPKPMLPSAPEVIGGKRITQGTSLSKIEIESIIEQAAHRHGIDPELGKAVAQAESSYNSKAVSQDGHSSKGLFQLLDSTAKEVMNKLKIDDPYVPFDAKQNANLGVKYLREMHDLFSEATKLTRSVSTHAAKDSDHLEKLALAAYNAGSGRVANAQARVKREGGDPANYDEVKKYIPESTREYVEKVTSYRVDETDKRFAKRAFTLDGLEG